MCEKRTERGAEREFDSSDSTASRDRLRWGGGVPITLSRISGNAGRARDIRDRAGGSLVLGSASGLHRDPQQILRGRMA